VPDGDPVAFHTFSFKLTAIFAGLVNENFHQDLDASTTLSFLAVTTSFYVDEEGK